VSPLVVDTSVAAKWYLDEPYADQALTLLRSDAELHAPTFLDVELDHVLCKLTRRGELASEEARSMHGAFETLPIVRHDTAFFRDLAFELALAHRRGIYDCLFVALAELLATHLVTADRRLLEGFHGTAIAHRILWVGAL